MSEPGSIAAVVVAAAVVVPTLAIYLKAMFEWVYCKRADPGGSWKRARRRRKGIRSVRVEFPPEIRAEALSAHRWCRYCRWWGAVLPKRRKSGYHADHIVSTSVGGLPEIANCQKLCGRCNMRKSGDGGPIRHANRVVFGAIFFRL